VRHNISRKHRVIEQSQQLCKIEMVNQLAMQYVRSMRFKAHRGETIAHNWVMRFDQPTELGLRHPSSHTRKKLPLARLSTMLLESLRRRQRHYFIAATLVIDPVLLTI